MTTETDDIKARLTALEQHRFELTEAQLNHLAEKAAERALENIYAQVGKGVLRKFMFLIGIVVISAAAYFAGKGVLVVPGSGQ